MYISVARAPENEYCVVRYKTIEEYQKTSVYYILYLNKDGKFDTDSVGIPYISSRRLAIQLIKKYFKIIKVRTHRVDVRYWFPLTDTYKLCE